SCGKGWRRAGSTPRAGGSSRSRRSWGRCSRPWSRPLEKAHRLERGSDEDSFAEPGQARERGDRLDFLPGALGQRAETLLQLKEEDPPESLNSLLSALRLHLVRPSRSHGSHLSVFPRGAQSSELRSLVGVQF